MSERRITRGAQFEFVTERVRLPNGREVDMDLVHHPGAAAVVPFLDARRVLLIRQHRHATGGSLLEIPAGKLDPGESPEDCALRELEEETGYRAGRLEPLTSIWTSPGFCDEVIHLFAARDLEPSEQRLEPDEILELVPTPLATAIEQIRRGELRDAKSVVALLLADRASGAAGPD